MNSHIPYISSCVVYLCNNTLVAALAGELSDRVTVAIEPGFRKLAGEAGYEAGVRVKNQVRMERERGRCRTAGATHHRE